MRVAIIGCGHIGSGLVKRLAPYHQLAIYDRDSVRTNKLAEETGSQACQKASEAIQKAEWIILAIKPQALKEAAKQINPFLQPNQLLISLLAGTNLNTLRSYFPLPSLLRIMPNLALIYGEGIIGIAEQENLSLEFKNHLETFFKPLGKIIWLPEAHMNALTSLTGSGPAFIFNLIEAMVEAAIEMGFKAREAQELIIQMIRGSLTLLEETNLHPGEIKWQIASPGGTTIAGLKKFEEEGLKGKFMNVFLAAYERANELSAKKQG